MEIDSEQLYSSVAKTDDEGTPLKNPMITAEVDQNLCLLNFFAYTARRLVSPYTPGLTM